MDVPEWVLWTAGSYAGLLFYVWVAKHIYSMRMKRVGSCKHRTYEEKRTVDGKVTVSVVDGCGILSKRQYRDLFSFSSEDYLWFPPCSTCKEAASVAKESTFWLFTMPVDAFVWALDRIVWRCVLKPVLKATYAPFKAITKS